MRLQKLHPSYVLAHRERVLPFLRHRLGRLAAPFFVGRRHRCPLCGIPLRGWARFFTSEHHGADGGLCPWCGSLTRTRQLWLWLSTTTALASARSILHVAPEPSLEATLRKRTGARVVTLDLLRDDVDVKADLTDLPFSDEEFDLILCSHVLEHVPDDAGAMAELLRVLRRGGLCCVMVPLSDRPTEEDPAAPPAERDRRFGQADHVRLYGPDIVDRLAAAGFRVDVVPLPAALSCSVDELRKLGVEGEDRLFVAERPQPSP